MYRQTQLEDWTKAMKVWYIYQKKYLTPIHQEGYHWLFRPFVEGMKRSNSITKLFTSLIKVFYDTCSVYNRMNCFTK